VQPRRLQALETKMCGHFGVEPGSALGGMENSDRDELLRGTDSGVEEWWR
jgi:hypothetical protein